MARIQIEGNELVIRVDINGEMYPSESGKMMMLDSTHGFTHLATPKGTLSVSLNVGTRDKNYGTAAQAGKPAAAQVRPQPNLVKNGQVAAK